MLLRCALASRGARRLTSSAAETNIGYLRLSFNNGADDHLALRARVFNTPTGSAFLASCPQTLNSLMTYGDEVYGTIGALPISKPQAKVPSGGLAYSEQGKFLCVFFGQTPAWPVHYFAQIEVGWEYLPGGRWRTLAVTKEDPLAMESF